MRVIPLDDRKNCMRFAFRHERLYACGTVISFWLNAGAWASPESWKRDVVEEIAAAGREFPGVIIQWEGQRSNLSRPGIPPKWYRDSVWFAQDGRYRISFGAVEQPALGIGLPLRAEFLSPQQVPFDQGNIRTAEGAVVILMPSRQRILAGQTTGQETIADGMLSQLALNPVGLAWWVDENPSEAESGLFQIGDKQFGIELPHHSMRCVMQKEDDGTWMVAKIERFDKLGEKTAMIEFDDPTRVLQTSISLGKIRTMKNLKPVQFAGKQYATSDQVWHLTNVFVGAVPDEFFILSEGGLVPVAVKPVPKERLARLTGQLPQPARVIEPEPVRPTPNGWWYVRIASIAGSVLVGAVVIRKRLGRAQC